MTRPYCSVEGTPNPEVVKMIVNSILNWMAEKNAVMTTNGSIPESPNNLERDPQQQWPSLQEAI